MLDWQDLSNCIIYWNYIVQETHFEVLLGLRNPLHITKLFPQKTVKSLCLCLVPAQSYLPPQNPGLIPSNQYYNYRFYLRPFLQRILFPLVPPTKTLHSLIFSPMHATRPAHIMLLYPIPQIKVHVCTGYLIECNCLWKLISCAVSTDNPWTVYLPKKHVDS